MKTKTPHNEAFFVLQGGATSIVLQFLQDGGVRFGEAVVRDFCARDPAPALSFEALRGNVPCEADVVEVEDDFRATVAVVVVGQGFAREIQAEFFAQFA